MSPLPISNDILEQLFQWAADENNTISASALRNADRKVYEWFVRNGLDWREYARLSGYQTKTRYPRGYWDEESHLVEALRRVEAEKGGPITRSDFVDFGYGSANQYIDSRFGGFANACAAAGVEQSASSGRDDGWINDETLVRAEFGKYATGNAVPNAAEVRRADSSFEALLRKRFGSYEAAAKAYGYEVPDARLEWDEEKIHDFYTEYFAPLTQRKNAPTSFDADQLSKWVRAVQNRYGSVVGFRERKSGKCSGWMTLYGFQVGPLSEKRVADALYLLGADARREWVTFPDGSHIAPDFSVYRPDGSKVFVEVLMLGRDTQHQTDKERLYQERWVRKVAKMHEHKLPLVTITPVILRDREALTGLIQRSVLNGEISREAKNAAARLPVHSEVRWTIESITEDARRVAQKIGRKPSQSELRALGAPGVVNAIYRRGYNMRWIQSRI